jgi:hypothetical protein
MTDSMSASSGHALVFTPLGVLTSFALLRRRFFAKPAVSALVFSPLVIPYLVFGISLLLLFALVDKLLTDWFGVYIGLGLHAIVIGHVVVTLPYTILTILPLLERLSISLEEDRPLPNGVIRVGTFSIEHENGKSFELRVSFTVPDLPGAFYSIAFCNDPCTISGFREPLTGVVSIVRTAREGHLLTEQSRLDSRIFGLRHQLRKAERAGEELRAQLFASEAERQRLSSELSRLEDELTAPLPRPRQGRRSMGGLLVASPSCWHSSHLQVRSRFGGAGRPSSSCPTRSRNSSTRLGCPSPTAIYVRGTCRGTPAPWARPPCTRSWDRRSDS